MGSSYLEHYGTPRKSGRYPWGSGGTKIAKGERLIKQGFTEKQVSDALGITIEEWRNQKAIAKGEEREAQRIFVTRERDAGRSIASIAHDLDTAPSNVRELLKPAANLKHRQTVQVADILEESIAKNRFIDVGEGVEVYLNVSKLKLGAAVQMLKNKGYQVFNLYQEQLGNPGKNTTVKVLMAPDATKQEVYDNKPNIAFPGYTFDQDTDTMLSIPSHKNMDSSRVLVRWNEDGGGDKDGLIEIRSGVPDLNIGNNRYAQVRIGVEGTHYLKGMAIMRDDIPKGYDVVYNVSKPKIDPATGKPKDKFAAFKENEVGKVTEFGTLVKPNSYIDENGKKVQGVLNIVGSETSLHEEGSWADWRKSIASQVLSKQPPQLAKSQLDLTYDRAVQELDEIHNLTQPTLRKHLLMDYAETMDKSAYELKAAALPRQSSHVLLPDPDMKPNEIYAPNYDNGEKVALIRYPHGGTFEIPELTVNNKYSEYRKLIGADAPDAVAIHPEVAHKLSGADFDGDTALVIPNNRGAIKTSPALKSLLDFEPKVSYMIPPDKLFDAEKNPTGIKPMTEKQKQRKMGEVSNLITDMTIQGASQTEIAAAVRHSMVVIDAAKHKLNYRQSYLDNNIANLKRKYQGGANKGASTIVSLAKSELRVPHRLDRYDIDPETGERIWSYTEKGHIDKKTGEKVFHTTKSTKLAEARTREEIGKLSSGTEIEEIYADHSYRMKQLANKARLEYINTSNLPHNREAYKTYKKQVESLTRKYKEAEKGKPVERKAQILGEAIYKDKVANNPDLDSKGKTKEKGRAIQIARQRLNAKKKVIDITPDEWQAIEMGAVSATALGGILRNADMNQVRAYATPRANSGGLSSGKKTRALGMIAKGYTNNEIATALGVPISQIRDINK